MTHMHNDTEKNIQSMSICPNVEILRICGGGGGGNTEDVRLLSGLW